CHGNAARRPRGRSGAGGAQPLQSSNCALEIRGLGRLWHGARRDARAFGGDESEIGRPLVLRRRRPGMVQHSTTLKGADRRAVSNGVADNAPPELQVYRSSGGISTSAASDSSVLRTQFLERPEPAVHPAARAALFNTGESPQNLQRKSSCTFETASYPSPLA